MWYSVSMINITTVFQVHMEHGQKWENLKVLINASSISSSEHSTIKIETNKTEKQNAQPRWNLHSKWLLEKYEILLQGFLKQWHNISSLWPEICKLKEASNKNIVYEIPMLIRVNLIETQGKK